MLLSPRNISKTALESYAIEAATFSTKGGLGSVEFALNHKGENDVAIFDFTSLFASENASRIVERKGKRLLLCQIGDSLLEVSIITIYMYIIHISSIIMCTSVCSNLLYFLWIIIYRIAGKFKC